MATVIAPDVESDFDYDFSPEEEQLLLQLASNTPATQPLPEPVPEEPNPRVAVDLVPGKTDSIADDEAALALLDASSHGLDQHLAPSAIGEALQVTREDTLTLNEDVRYPNCICHSTKCKIV